VGFVTSKRAVVSIGAAFAQPCTRAIQNIQVIARPLGSGPGDLFNLLGRHSYFLVTFEDGGKNTYGAYPDGITNALTPRKGKLQDPVDPPGGCGTDSSPQSSVCLPLVLRPSRTYSEIIAHLERAVQSGSEGVYSARTNNSNTWVKRRLNELVSTGAIDDVRLPASAVSNAEEFNMNIPVASARIAALRLPTGLIISILLLIF